MNSKERHQHLEYIRDFLYKSYKAYSQVNWTKRTPQEVNDRKYRAISFISALKALRCIGKDGSALQTVSAFCDHTVAIFNAFFCNFIFLPDEYREQAEQEKDLPYSRRYAWLNFFREIGLKQTVSQEEFIQFCQETASGEVSDIRKCSQVLLHHLLVIQYAWQQDAHFLQRVSDIAFLQQENLPELTWLVSSAYPVNQMVSLRGSAPLHRAPLLWTTKPIVKLPGYSETNATKLLGIIIDPSMNEVMENITNICKKSQYAQQSLFVNYPKHLTCDAEHRTLLDVMSKIFDYLDFALMSQNNLAVLRSLSCVPVHHAITSRPRVTASQDTVESEDLKMVLVKPCCVVHARGYSGRHDIIDFHPYLHLLPDLKPVQSRLLGVKGNLELSHIQIALEGAFHDSEENPLLMNTDKCVKSAIEKLHHFLLDVQTAEEDVGMILSPLYLPDSENVLRPSKSLLYGDTTSYLSEDMDLDLSNAEYFHFNISPPDYQYNAIDICRVLPESVRPIALSAVCKQVVLDESREPEDSNLAVHDSREPADSLAVQLMKTIAIPEIPDGVVALVSMLVGKQVKEADLREMVRTYLEKIETVTVSDLKSTIVLKDSEECVGSLKIKFCYAPGEDKSVLYLDSSLKFPVEDEDVYEEVAEHLCSLLCKDIEGKLEHHKKEILRVIKMCLKSRNVDAVKRVLLKFGVHLDGVRMRRFAAKLGEEVPECWHHRLDQDIDNVFNPMEYVGYEDKDGHIVVAQIAYPEKPKEGEMEMQKKYKIYVRENDEDGVSVSILTIYKFLVGKKKPKIKPIAAENEDLAVVPFDGDDDLASYRASLVTEDVVEIKKKICAQLREIWKLSPQLRSKAVKRLYLRWHPDKNPGNQKEAEKIFKYLMKQLEHLERGEPLDDPAAEELTPNGGYRYWYSSSSYNFNKWNRTARHHNTYFEGERTFFGASQGSSSRSRSHFFPFEGPEDNKKPEEGERWVKQAEAEFKVLLLNHTHGGACSGYFYVCFMAHQVAEKALKGGVYALCGMDGRGLTDHNLIRHACALEAVLKKSEGLVSHATQLEDYYLKPRYPNCWSGYMDTPAAHYTAEDADEAKEHAEAILTAVRAVMPLEA